jgi:hypothetical protein
MTPRIRLKRNCTDCGKPIRSDNRSTRCNKCADQHRHEAFITSYFKIPGTEITARRDIAQAIFEKQKAYAQDLEEELKVGHGTLYDAIKVLEQAGYVKRTKEHLPYNTDKTVTITRYAVSLGIKLHYTAVKGSRGRPYTVLHWIGPALPDLLAAPIAQ